LKKSKLFFIYFFIFISTTLLDYNLVNSSPPWLAVGFYAKYVIVDQNTIDPEGFNGTLFWKVEKIEGSNALIKINLTLAGHYYVPTDRWESYNLSKSFHLLVDINSRFILNTTKDDPFYFTYWIPIGTKEGEKTLLGHYQDKATKLNFWFVGTFYGYPSDLYVETNWKNFHGNDLICLSARNETHAPEPWHTSEHPWFFFHLSYDRATGILISFDQDPLLLRFLGLEFRTDGSKGHELSHEVHFANGTVKIGKYISYSVIDSIGIEPVYESLKNESSKNNEVHNVFISSFVVPSNIEAGKDFELSTTILNNGTADEKNISIQLYSTNESIKFLSSKEFLVESIRPQEAKEVKWKIELPSEGSYVLELSITKNDTALFQKTFFIHAESSLAQKFLPFIAGSFLVLILALLLVINKSRKRVKLSYE